MTTRYDQTDNMRDSNSTTPFTSVWDERTAEQTLTNYQRGRERLTRDRIEEEVENEETNLQGRDTANTVVGFLPDRIKKPVTRINRIGNRLPVPSNIPSILFREAISLLPALNPLTNLLDTAEKNRLKTQDAIAPKISGDNCGISISTPFFSYSLVDNNCRPDKGKDTYKEPVPPPTTAHPWSGSAPWAGFAAGQAGTTHTLHWNYTGYVELVVVSNTNNSLSSLINQFVTVGSNYNVYVFAPVNPPGSYYPYPVSRFGWQDGIVDVSGRLIQGHAATAGFPTKGYSNSHIVADNRQNPSTWQRRSLYGACHVLGKQAFHVGGGNNAWYLYVSINWKMTIIIGNMGDWSIFPDGTRTIQGTIKEDNVRDLYIKRFFECPQQQGTTWGNVAGIPEIVTFTPEKAVTPPPPPPRKRCDCMSNCCPQNESELAEIKRLIKAMYKMIGEPETVPLWDVDISTQGKKVQKKKPESLTKHLALVNERIEMALRIIGIHDLPIEVEASASAFENVARMLMAAPNQTMQSLGKALLDRTTSRVKINSVIDYMTWVQETIHEKLGHWEQELNISDIDLLESGNQSSKAYFPSIAEMLNTATKYSIDSAVKSEAIANIATRALLEVVSVKKMLAEVGYQVDATADYLGFEYVETSESMNVLANLKEKDLSKLADILKESKIPIKKVTLAKGEQPLESKLVMLQQAAAIIKAVHTIPLGNDEREGKEIIKEMLKASLNLGAGDDWEAWLKRMNEDLAKRELPMEIKELKDDKP